MNLKLLRLLAAVTGGTALATAAPHIGLSLSIGVPAPIVVREAPPPRVVETVVVSPGPGYVWIAGHHSWREGRWAWVPGVWVQPPQPNAVWVEGRWDGGSRAWTESHWEIAAPRPPPAPVVVVAPAPRAEVIVRVPPPPPRRERHGRAPGRDMVWINGFWAFREGRHVWVAGHWDRVPAGHRVWVEPRWERRGGNYVFVEGCWN